LGLQRAFANTKGVVDQWQLIHTGLYAICDTQPETWTCSFVACNLDPRVCLDFRSWCKKISNRLTVGQTFKDEEAIDTYSLLPSWWHGIHPEEKCSVVATVEKYGGYSMQCLKELRDVNHIKMDEMQNA